MIREIIATLITYKILPHTTKQFYLTDDKILIVYAYNVNIYMI